MKIAHQIREQLEFYRKNQSQLEHHGFGAKEDFEIKKSTRNLISLSGNLEKSIHLPPVDSGNYLRTDLEEEWEPKI